MGIIEDFNAKSLRKVPQIQPGDTVRVHTKIREGNKERIQIFEGVVLKCQNGIGINATVTVRKISYGIGVEKTFLVHSPQIEKIQVVKRSRVRRANISYLRGLTGKSAKLKDKQFDSLAVNVKEDELAPADKEEKIDEELTELKDDVMTKTTVVSIEEVEKGEEKEATLGENPEDGEDEQALAEEETEAGVEKAEEDIEKGKSTEGSKAEKVVEDNQDKK